MMKKEYFEILNLEPPASEEEIKQAYRVLAKMYHPDKNPDPGAHEKFLKISEAYEYLLDELKHTNERTIRDLEDFISHEYFEEMRRKARERAQEKARIRFEKLQKEQEAFQESGLYDFVLLSSYFGRYALLILCAALVVLPFYLMFYHSGTPFLLLITMLFFGAFGLYFITKAGKKYFFAGNFYYNFRRIRDVFSKKNTQSQEKCFFSPHYKADSVPYKVNMIKIKDIQLHNYGPGQHGVAFNQKSVTVNIPRSHHALIVHAVLIALKLSILIGCIIFLNIESLLWRIIIALILTFIISKIVLILTNTRSTVSYLVTTGLLIRIFTWFILILIFSYIQFRPFNIYTSENIYGIAVFMLFFDTFLDQFLNFISNRKFQIPLFKQHPVVQAYLDKKFQFGYDMPVFSVFYPVYKWFLG